VSVPGAMLTRMTTYDEWKAARVSADLQAAAAASNLQATVTSIGPGLWMVSVAGATRGSITQIEVKGELRFQARLRHLDPGRGTRIGEYWELGKAVAALMAEVPRYHGRDPFRELTNYVSRDQMRERTERARQRRRGSRYS
jgi:hypothetical protein